MTETTFVVVYMTHVVRIMIKMLKKKLVEIRIFDYHSGLTHHYNSTGLHTGVQIWMPASI